MRIYFSGIGGVGIGPLVQIARDMGYEVFGSELHTSLMTEQLAREGIEVVIGQDGSRIAELHQEKPIDWFVYTAALKEGRPELDFCKANGIRTAKRDEFIAHIISEKNLKLIAVSGTHGKTTTTSLLIWTMRELGIPVSYSVGTTLSFAPSGALDPESEYFVYECDEFDRNMLAFEPHLSLITSLDYDHPDTYPTADEYKQAFVRFIEQSGKTFLWEKDLRYLETDLRADIEAYDELMDLSRFTLHGDHNRHNAFLVERAIEHIKPGTSATTVINAFPGAQRRMEKLGDNLYTDYAHHPVEIAATLQAAHELSDHIVVVYQPHQNVRQHEIKNQYTDCFELAEKVYWLPTYLSRENPDLEMLSSEVLAKNVSNRDSVEFAEMDDELWDTLQQARDAGKLVLCMGAGDIDGWVRQQIDKINI